MAKEIRKDVVVYYVEGDPVTGNPLVGEPEYALDRIREFISDYKKMIDRTISTVIVTCSQEIAWNTVDMFKERLAFIMSDSSSFMDEISDAGLESRIWVKDVDADFSKALESLRIINERDEEKKIEREETKIT